MIIIMTILLMVFSLFDTVQAAEFIFNESDGTITGTAGTPTHDFPVQVTAFNVTISDISQGGYRTIEVLIPVEKITTENERRDGHMFSGVLLKDQYPHIRYVATTDFLYPEEGNFILKGVLKIHDIEKKLDIEGHIHRNNNTWVAKADFYILLSEYELSRPGFGPMKVKNRVDMSVYLKTVLPKE